MRHLEKTKEIKVGIVFFACIYDHDFEHFQKVEKGFGFPWSGLYLHARSFRMPGSPMPYTGVIPCPEKIFSSELMRSAAVLDEGGLAPMGDIAGGKPIVLMPDFTDEDLPADGDDGAGLANKVMSFAQGRPVVCLLGHLQRTKGLSEFTMAAQNEHMNGVVFFLGGELNWTEIDSDEIKKLKRAWANSDNIITHFTDLADAQINAVISVSDVVYAAYKDFPNSSNILTKAAVFKKPVIVSDGYVMAERVREYGLGEVVTEGDAEDVAKTLKRMLAEGYSENLESRARWDEYHSVHAVERLPECFEQLLS